MPAVAGCRPDLSRAGSGVPVAPTCIVRLPSRSRVRGFGIFGLCDVGLLALLGHPVMLLNPLLSFCFGLKFSKVVRRLSRRFSRANDPPLQPVLAPRCSLKSPGE
jgi:hypothetical protein